MVTYVDGQKASGSFDKASQINMNDGRTVEDAVMNLKPMNHRIANGTVGSSQVTLTTSQPITNYQFLYAWVKAGDFIRGEFLIPADRFLNGKFLMGAMVSGTLKEVDVIYNSSNSISVQNNSGVTLEFNLEGIDVV